MTEVQTGVDQLMELVKKEGKMSLDAAAKQLGHSQATVQAWVDFLVEEHILGIEYKFTTPYIYVHDEQKLERVEHAEENYTLEDFRNGFYEKAREKDIPEQRIPAMWQEHLRYVVNNHKQFFIEECGRRSVPEAQDLFEEYAQEVLGEA